MSYRITELVWANSRSAGLARLVLLALASYANDRTGVAFPRLELLEQRTQIHRTTILRHLKRLVKIGELEVVSGAGGGRTPVHYRVVTADAAQRTLIPRTNGHHPSQSATPHPSQSATRGDLGPVAERDGSLSTTAKAAVAVVRHEPVSEPVIEPVRGTRAASGANLQTKIPTVQDEERGLLKEAKEVWLELRRKKGLTRYTDSRATSGLRLSVKRALDQRIEWRDIETGIRGHATDEKANPWYADEWARVAESDRRAAEHLTRKMRERAADDQRWLARRTGPRPITESLARIPGTVADITSADEPPQATVALARPEHRA